MRIIGIDPGTDTGIAIWDAAARRFVSVESLKVHRALERVRQELLTDRRTPVICEDARQRKWFGNVSNEPGRREGAGAAKRDATIWDDFLADMGCSYLMRPPSSTKFKADYFARITGWTPRTNEHGRDAGMLVYAFSVSDVTNAMRIGRKADAVGPART